MNYNIKGVVLMKMNPNCNIKNKEKIAEEKIEKTKQSLGAIIYELNSIKDTWGGYSHIEEIKNILDSSYPFEEDFEIIIRKMNVFKNKLSVCRSTEDGLIYYINSTNETVNIIQSNQEQVLSWDLLRELQESSIQKIETEKLSLEQHHITHIVNSIQEG